MTEKKSSHAKDAKKSDHNFAGDPLREKIGGNLRQIYDEVVNEPVPDDFLELLAKADSQEDSDNS